MVAKILSILSQAGLVTGLPGPGGGFCLADDPSRIKIFDVFSIFERQEEVVNCPFGGGVCGGDDPCPLHERLTNVKDAMDQLLHETTFGIFHKPAG
jgi:Rrf2 family protein